MTSRERVCQRNGGGAVALQVIGLLNGKNPTKAEASEHVCAGERPEKSEPTANNMQ